jgi:hypothetical protein
MTRQKVFCVGLGKTGTTSLKESLRILGYRTIRLPLDWKGIHDFDAALPGVSAARYRELDAEFPGSKFILTVRDVEGWLKSIERDMGRKKDVPRERGEERDRLLTLLYGTTVFDSDTFRLAYHAHVDRVQSYFRDRPDDLLVLNVTTQAGWGPLCSFLGVAVPDMPFPNINKAAELDELLLRLLHVTRDMKVASLISKYSHDYLENLAQGHDIEHYDMQAPLVLQDDRRINKVLKRSSKYFGGITRAASVLNLPEEAFREAIARQKRHARAKLATITPLARMRRILLTALRGRNRY